MSKERVGFDVVAAAVRSYLREFDRLLLFDKTGVNIVRKVNYMWSDATRDCVGWRPAEVLAVKRMIRRELELEKKERL